jgi:hypothetical protein
MSFSFTRPTRPLLGWGRPGEAWQGDNVDAGETRPGLAGGESWGVDTVVLATRVVMLARTVGFRRHEPMLGAREPMPAELSVLGLAVPRVRRGGETTLVMARLRHDTRDGGLC